MGECTIIFVTIGMHSQGFERLIKKMDEIAGKISEKVIMQIGNCEYKPINTKYFNFVDYKEFIDTIKRAKIIVCHGGAGSIITALSFDKPVITVPRLKKFNEAVDDHQLELVEALKNIDKIHVVYDLNDLDVIIQMDFIGNGIKTSSRNNLIKGIRTYLNHIHS